MQATSKRQVLQRIIQLVLHGIHLLLTHRRVENCLSSVLMNEKQCVRLGNNAVMTGYQSLWSRELIAGLKAFTLGELDVTGSPRLISHFHIGLLFLYGHLDMYYRLMDISPYQYPFLTVCHLTIAVV